MVNVSPNNWPHNLHSALVENHSLLCMPWNQEYLIKIYFMEIIYFFHIDDFDSTVLLWNYWRGGQSDQVQSEERNCIHYLKRKFNIKNNEIGIKLNGKL